MESKTSSEDKDLHAGATAHLLAGAEHAQEGRIQEAENAFAAALLQSPGLHIARFQLGLLQWSTARTGAALVTWQPLVDAPTGLDLGHFARAFHLWAASDLPAAAAELNEGLACCTNAPLARDMRQLLATISDDLAQGSDDAQHVLLRNYMGDGHVH